MALDQDNRISDLPAATTLTGSEIFPLDQDGVTCKALLSSLLALISVTADNGITDNSGVLELGGSLKQTTTIVTNNGTSDFTLQIQRAAGQQLLAIIGGGVNVWDSNSKLSADFSGRHLYAYDSGQILSIDYQNLILNGNWDLAGTLVVNNGILQLSGASGSSNVYLVLNTLNSQFSFNRDQTGMIPNPGLGTSAFIVSADGAGGYVGLYGSNGANAAPSMYLKVDGVQQGGQLIGNWNIATNPGHLLGFWGATPIAQPQKTITPAAFLPNSSGIADDSATYNGWTVGAAIAALIASGQLHS